MKTTLTALIPKLVRDLDAQGVRPRQADPVRPRICISEPTESQDCPAFAKCRWRLEWNEASCDKQEQTVSKLSLASPGDVLMDAAKRYRVDTEKLQKAVAEELAAKRDRKTKATAKRKARKTAA